MAPNRNLVLKPYKLVIYKEGGHFDVHRDTVRDENHIGTLVLILHSDYTGGELEITHGGHSVSVSGGGNWVAMYGDALHTIRPVTSGTRVSLIFDILSFPSSSSSDSTDDVKTEVTTSTVQTIDSDRLQNTYTAIDKELEKYDTVSISLNHLYPACQANVDFLKGEDQSLYYALKDRYNISTTPIFIHREIYYGDYEQRMFFDQYYSPYTTTASYYDNDLIKENEKNVLFVPKTFDESIALSYDPYIEHTGNSPQAETTVYLVTALVVRK